MCGIAGFISHKCADPQSAVVSMTSAIKHRGPDDSSFWSDKSRSVWFGFRRLEIVGLGEQGRQPMTSSSGRYTIVYNGEVYNFLNLKRDLINLGYSFRGECDTEVILEAFEAWGITEAVKKFNGMFAFAVWDQKEEKLILCRDRLGIKPLYYGWNNGFFLFCSELRGINKHPFFNGEISQEAVALYLRYSYIPTPYSIYRGIYKLPAGCFLSVKLDYMLSEFSPFPDTSKNSPYFYWNLRDVVTASIQNPFKGDISTAIAYVRDLLTDSVRLRLIADVPLGAFLSGGIDSSLVVSTMSDISSSPIKTFSVGFEDKNYDESIYAKQVANYLGTSHTECVVTAEDVLKLIPNMPAIYDEPLGDVSLIPTYLISKIARKHVKVSLSGDGGDEIFGGYDRYIYTSKIKRLLSLPYYLRKGFSAIVRLLKPTVWDTIYRLCTTLGFGRSAEYHSFGEKLYKLADLLRVNDIADPYQIVISHFVQPSNLMKKSADPPPTLSSFLLPPESLDYISSLMYFDLTTYLQDDILVKLDRATMAASLEGRVPLLDHRLVEFSWQLPISYKIRQGVLKYILKEVLKTYLPTSLIDRPKKGFAVPLGEWLRRDLREWGESLLSKEALASSGILQPEPIRKLWRDHICGQRNFEYYLWDILCLQSWLREN